MFIPTFSPLLGSGHCLVKHSFAGGFRGSRASSGDVLTICYDIQGLQYDIQLLFILVNIIFAAIFGLQYNIQGLQFKPIASSGLAHHRTMNFHDQHVSAIEAEAEVYTQKLKIYRLSE